MRGYKNKRIILYILLILTMVSFTLKFSGLEKLLNFSEIIMLFILSYIISLTILYVVKPTYWNNASNNRSGNLSDIFDCRKISVLGNDDLNLFVIIGLYMSIILSFIIKCGRVDYTLLSFIRVTLITLGLRILNMYAEVEEKES